MLKRLKFLYRITVNTINKWVADEIPMHGAALAFYTIFSIAPVLIIIVSVIGWLWGDYTALYELRRVVSDYLDPQMARTVDEILQQAVGKKGVAMPIISGIVLLFASTTALAQLKFTLNTIFKVKNSRWQRRPTICYGPHASIVAHLQPHSATRVIRHF
jgi:membrane protein